MAPYPSNGSLTTDKRTINDSDGWGTQSEWEAYQSASNVVVTNGTVQLAEAVGFIEDFERTDVLSPYNGITNEFAETTSTVFNGSKALEVTDTSKSNPQILSAEGDGLGTYPQPDTIVSYWMYTGNTSPNNVQQSGMILGGAYAGSDGAAPEGYLFGGEPRNDVIAIYKASGGFATHDAGSQTIASTTDSYMGEDGNWVEFRCRVGSDNTVAMTAYTENGVQIADLSAADSDYVTNTGIGWKVDQDSITDRQVFDYAHEVESL